MAIVRLGQFGAESRSEREFQHFDNSGFPPDTTAARTGTYSFDIGADGASFGSGYSFSQDYSALRMSFYYNIRGILSVSGSNSIYLARFLNGSTDIFSARMTYDSGMITFSINGVDQATTISRARAGVAAARRWLHLGWTCSIGAPGFASFYVDGRQVWNYVGAITGAMDNVRFYAAGNTGYNSNCFIDDFYVDAIEGEVDSAPPTRKFFWIQPNGAGATSQWTPNTASNWQAVDEAPPDGDTTYIKAQTVGLKDSYNVSSLAVPQDHSIYAVIPMAYLRKTDAAAPSEISLHTFDGTLYDEGANQGNLPTDYHFRFERFPTTPGALAWTEAAVNTIQLGITLVG